MEFGQLILDNISLFIIGIVDLYFNLYYLKLYCEN